MFTNAFMYERLGTPNECESTPGLPRRSQGRSKAHSRLTRALAAAFRGGFRA